MRRMSPLPMEEDTPPRPKTPNSNASSDFLDPVALLLPDSPQYGEQVLASDWPRGREMEQDAPWNVEGINQMTRLAELARRLPEVAYRRIGQLGPNHQDFVHMVMPLDDVRVATSLRSGFRPLFPYPFMGRIRLEERPAVRLVLEAEWNAQAARLANPTVVQVASLVQLRTLWRWEQGWRRSRRTGQWIFLGDRGSYDFVTRMASENEDRGPLRLVALRRLAAVEREEATDGPLIAVEAQRRMMLLLHQARREIQENNLRALGLDPREFPPHGEQQEHEVQRNPGREELADAGRREDDQQRMLAAQASQAAQENQQRWLAAEAAQAQAQVAQENQMAA